MRRITGAARSASASPLRHLLDSKFNQDVLWNVGSLAFLAGGGVLINLIIMRFRGEAALGVFNQVYAFYIVLSQLGVGGLQHSVLKHVSYHQDDRPLCADITTSALLLILAITLPLILASVALAEPVGRLLNSQQVALGLQLVAPGLLFFAFNKALINTLNGLRHMRAYAVFRSLRFVLIPLVIVAVVALGLEDAWLALSLTAAEVVLFFALAAYVFGRAVPLRWPHKANKHFAEHISFGARGLLSGILLELNTRVDVLMLGFFTTDATVGIFSFAAIMAEGFAQLPLAVRWNVDPIIGRYFAEGRHDQISALARRIRRVFYPIMVGVGLVAVGVYPLFYRLMTDGVELSASWQVFAIIMLGVTLGAGYRPFSGLLLQGGRPGSYTAFVVGLVSFNVVMNALLIPNFGLYGAATATMMTLGAEALLLVVLARRMFAVRL